MSMHSVRPIDGRNRLVEERKWVPRNHRKEIATRIGKQAAIWQVGDSVDERVNIVWVLVEVSNQCSI